MTSGSVGSDGAVSGGNGSESSPAELPSAAPSLLAGAVLVMASRAPPRPTRDDSGLGSVTIADCYPDRLWAEFLAPVGI